MNAVRLEETLKALAEPGYQAFSAKLLPPAAAEKLLGVRLPALRKIARELARSEWRTFLRECPDDYMEETMLQGMVIGCAQAQPEETLAWVQQFVPKIDNWSVCDSFCAGLKTARKAPETVWQFLQPYLADEREYYARFGLIMLLDYFAEETYAKSALQQIDRMSCTAYYAHMAAAWAVSIFYIHCPQTTMEYLRRSHLDTFSYNKALQKITESYRVSAEEKQIIRGMKRG